MPQYPNTRRAAAAAVTAGVFGLIGAAAWFGGTPSPSAAAADTTAAAELAKVWPEFGGTPSRNMVNTSARLPDDVLKDVEVKAGKGVKWKAALGSRAYGGPTIGNGKILVGTNNNNPRDPSVVGDRGVVMCFDQATGKFQFQAVYDKLPAGQVNDWENEGVCSTPLIEGDRAYFVSNRCEVECITLAGLADGKNVGVTDEKYKGKIDADTVWRFDMMKDPINVFPHNMSSSSPTIVGDTLFVITSNGVDAQHLNIPSPQAPSFIALNKKTGKLLWQSNAPGNNIMHGQWSNPTFGVFGGQPTVVFPGGDGYLYGFEPGTGKELWKFDCNPKDSKYQLGGKGTKSDFIATPVVVDGKIVIGTGQDPEHFEGIGHLRCIDPAGKSGDVSPELVTDGSVFPPKTKPNPNSAEVWHYGGPDPRPDRQRDYVFGRTMSTVSIHDGLVYAGELAGYVHCLDFKTGKPYWVQDLKSAVWGSTYWVDGKVLIGTEDGDVWVFPHGKEKPTPQQIEIGQPIRSTPVVVDGVMYVMTESTLFAIGK